jgi:hypothetical protein
MIHLFYKEWLKTRWFVLAGLVVGVASIVYMFIQLNTNIINAEGASQYIYDWQRGGRAHYLLFRWIPILVALLIGVSQYAPEVLQKRIKLTLHLPRPEMSMLYTMVLYGFICLSAIMLICMGLFFTADAYFMPQEMHVMAIKALVPYIMAGYVTYAFVAMIAMEPNWSYGFFYLILAYFIVNDLFLNNPDTWGTMPVLLLILVIASLGMLYTANRFKLGER